MTQPISVSDFASNAPEQIEHFAQLLVNSPLKTRLFEEIYRGKRSVKTVKELADKLGVPEKRVLTIGKPLADRHLFYATKLNKRVAYMKIPTVTTVKQQILRLAGNKSKLKEFPTKRKLLVKPTFTIKNVLKSPTPKFVSIDEVDQFRSVERIIEIPEKLDPLRLAESVFKKGVGKLLGETALPVDWGGEPNDVFSVNLRINGKRYPAAFAFKGPAITGRLTPRKMGKNGDQIPRLFNSNSAQVFFVQYEGEIDQSVIDLMKNLAVAKSAMSGHQIWWGVINRRDTYRLRIAYPQAFKVS
jgi:hypothetical protein